MTSAHTTVSAPAPATAGRTPNPSAFRSEKGVTLVESMMALLVFSMVILTIMAAFLQSRRSTESAVLHAAATSLVYGVIEQMKQSTYDEMPSQTTDPYEVDANGAANANATAAPLIKVRINQDLLKWFRVRYKEWPVGTASTSWWGPFTTPSPYAAAADVGGPAGTGDAVDNLITNLPLSQVSGTASQKLNLNFWVWVEEIPDAYAPRVKRITVIYTYDYIDGSAKRSVRDREVFLLTKNAESP